MLGYNTYISIFFLLCCVLFLHPNITPSRVYRCWLTPNSVPISHHLTNIYYPLPTCLEAPWEPVYPAQCSDTEADLRSVRRYPQIFNLPPVLLFIFLYIVGSFACSRLNYQHTRSRLFDYLDSTRFSTSLRFIRSSLRKTRSRYQGHHDTCEAYLIAVI